MNCIDHTHPILVLGGTGKTGRRLVARLRADGAPVRVGSRSGTPRFDWEDSSTWPEALRGVSAVYLSYYPDLAVPGAADTVAAFAREAVAAGVPRVVLLSGRGEPEAQRAEEAVRDAGTELTVLRCSWFMQNLSEEYMLEHVLAGQIRLPAGAVRIPFVDAEDIADVAHAALTEPGHEGRRYELSGPRALTLGEVAAEISAASGRQVDYVPVSLDRHGAEAAAHGVDGEVIDFLTYLFSEVAVERNSSLTDGVRRALGREPTDFSVYARRVAASGAWDPASAPSPA